MYLQDILDAMNDILSYVEGMTSQEFEADKRTFDAVVRNLGIMGEAVKNLPGDLKKDNPGVPWRDIAGMRDKVIHAYFGVSHQIIWHTIHEDFPTLRASVERIKSQLE